MGGGLDAGQVDPFDGGVGSVTSGAEDERFDAGGGVEGGVEPGRLAGDAGGGEDPLRQLDERGFGAGFVGRASEDEAGGGAEFGEGLGGGFAGKETAFDL